MVKSTKSDYRQNRNTKGSDETLYGGQQGGRKGHNRKHRGKNGDWPVLCPLCQGFVCYAGGAKVL